MTMDVKDFEKADCEQTDCGKHDIEEVLDRRVAGLHNCWNNAGRYPNQVDIIFLLAPEDRHAKREDQE